MRLILLFAFLLCAVQTNAQVIISELHYDNTGGDVNEGVEVTGPAGTDISDYQLVFYNGNGGAVYDTYTFPAGSVFTDQDNGFGVLVALVSGIQNGAPDGVALVDDTGTVLQFISYEGDFIASDGPANSMTSTNIGVTESSSTGIDESLSYDGVWNAPATSTFGMVNPGLAAFLPVSLVSLTAHTMPKSTMVKWATAQESGNDYFAVERSLDGRSFQEIGRVSGAGDAATANSYVFEDETPIAGTSYYRLRQVDFSGVQEIFGPVAVERVATSATAFPNPTNDRLFVRGAAAGAELTILDLSGRVVSRNLASDASLDVSTLRPGTYLIQIADATGTQTLRFIRK